MADKTSLRFFENIPVRAVWDEESAKWWFCAMDIAEALTKSKIRENIGNNVSKTLKSNLAKQIMFKTHWRKLWLRKKQKKR